MIAAALQQAALAGALGSAAVLAVWGLCALLRRAHAPGWLLCALWLAVGVRFAVPGGVIPLPVAAPQSTVLQQAASQVEMLAAPAAPGDAAASPRALTDLPARETDVPTPARPTPADLLGALWLGGAAVCLLHGAVQYRRLRRRVALACKAPDGCYSCAAVTAPFTLGLLRPRIYLPEGLTGEARAAVLLHERAHIRRGDPLLKPLYYAVVCLHWWNPLAWLAFRELGRAMEQACDEAALRGRTPAERAAYCESLLQFALRSPAPGALAFGQSPARGRILHALRYRQPGKAALAACLAAAILASAVLLARPVRAGETAEPSTPAVTPAPSPISAAADAPAETGNALSENAGSAAPETPADDGRTAAGSFLVPVDFSYISRYFSADHKGDDLCAPQGTPVMAAADGVVTTAEFHPSYGNYIVIDHGGIGGHRWKTLYAHLDSLTVAAGDAVVQGQQIGTVGHSGTATGNALHLELYCDDARVAPRLYFPYTETMLGLPDSDGSLLDLLHDPEMLDLAIKMTGQSWMTSDGKLPREPLDQYSRISCAFSEDSQHYGVDFATASGTPVRAADDGVALAAGWHYGYGNYLLLYHGKTGDGASVVTLYTHFRAPSPLAVGMTVKAGDEVGLAGTTGVSTGPHLHFELWRNGEETDPMEALAS